MTDFENMGPYAIALLMSIGALCAFVWGVLSGALSGADDAAIRFYCSEVENDAAREHTEQANESQPGPRDGGVRRRLHQGTGRAHPGLAVGRLRGAFHLGALLRCHLLGWAWAGTVRLTAAVANGDGDATDRESGGDADR